MLVSLGGGLALALVFMAAESLSRRAFPDHPQLWRLWSREAAPTPAVLGRTLGGYLSVPIELALIAAFYFVTNRYFGWWQPSETLTDPNILGSALPALVADRHGPAGGVHGGVPVPRGAVVDRRADRHSLRPPRLLHRHRTGAAGARFRRRRTPTIRDFPPYSRLVELAGPAFVWGLIFVRFGLLPTVILHAVFDLAADVDSGISGRGPGSTINQALVIAAGLVPLAIVLLRRRFRDGSVARASRSRCATAPGNPAAAPASSARLRRVRAAAGAWTARVQRALPVLGLDGLGRRSLVAGKHGGDAPPLEIDRAQAEAAADAALAERGMKLAAGLAALFDHAHSSPTTPGNAQWHQFVWREAGRDAYRQLIGNWLAPPLWEVRYARFDGGDVADRAEEWRVTVAGDGKVRGVRHRLPEQRPGAKLSREQARSLAQQEIRQRFGLDPAALREVSAEEDAQPARTDWQFTYADPARRGRQGRRGARDRSIAGDEVTASGRYVFVPEDWQRAERERASRLSLAKIVVVLMFSSPDWQRSSRRSSPGAAVTSTSARSGSSLASFGAALVNAVDQWPALAMQLKPPSRCCGRSRSARPDPVRCG